MNINSVNITDNEYLDLIDKIPDPYSNSSYHKHYPNEEDEYKLICAYNRKLTNLYPFLVPRNRITDEVDNGYDYSYTELDDMPTGWRRAFGIQMCEEIKNELVKFNYLNDYRIMQIKEKFGELMWYDNGSPIGKLGESKNVLLDSLDDLDREHYTYEYLSKDSDVCLWYFKRTEILEPCRINEIIDKYIELSKTICIKCGKPATKISTSWISPWCDDCANYLIDRINSIKFKDLNNTGEDN